MFSRHGNRGGHVMRRFGGGRAPKASREWVPMNGGVTTTAGAVTKLLEFQAPTVTFGTALTSDTPEDKTILRIVGNWTAVAPGGGSDSWIGLLVADANWTPVGTSSIIPDLDKRFLWYVYLAGLDTTNTSTWSVNTVVIGSTTKVMTVANTQLDISPKVKLEDGKALMAVCYTGGTALTSFTFKDMRLLMQRSSRRR